MLFSIAPAYAKPAQLTAAQKAQIESQLQSQAAGGGAAASSGQSLSQFPQEPTPTDTTTTATTTTAASTSGGNISTTVEIVVFVIAVLLLGMIAYVIMRDARRAAPAGGKEHSGSGQRGTVAPRADRVKRSRARAKAARQARKRAR